MESSAMLLGPFIYNLYFCNILTMHVFIIHTGNKDCYGHVCYIGRKI